MQLDNEKKSLISGPGKARTYSAAAERMRRHRERRKNKLRCLTIQIRESEIDALTRKGFLQLDARNDTNSVLAALYEFFERTLGLKT
jgi:hypothetical protein